MPQVKEVDKHIYTVSELTRDIKLILESSLGSLWLEGEVSNFSCHFSSGHMYFDLKDEKAVIRTCLFRNVGQHLKFKIKDGLQVTCFGRLNVYDKKGNRRYHSF